jgi:hypothetical protein
LYNPDLAIIQAMRGIDKSEAAGQGVRSAEIALSGLRERPSRGLSKVDPPSYEKVSNYFQEILKK